MERRFLSTVVYVAVIFLVAASASKATEPPPARGDADQVEVGNQYFDHGRFADALEAWNVALDRYRATGDQRGQTRVLQHKAEAYLAIGHNYDAIRTLKDLREYRCLRSRTRRQRSGPVRGRRGCTGTELRRHQSGGHQGARVF